MLIQKEIEKRIMLALGERLKDDKLDDSVSVTGSWQPVDDGLVKWIERDKDSVACLSVSVGTPTHPTFSTPEVQMSANVSLFVRYELDLTGVIIAHVAEIVQDIFDEWQEENYQRHFDYLDFESFTLGEITVSAGSSPVVNNNLVSVTWPVNIVGVRERPIKQTNN